MDAAWTSRLDVDPSHPAFDGHFPGRPVLPGVALLAAVIEAALDEPALARRLGPAPRLVVAKFFAPVVPGRSLAIAWREAAATLDWRVADGTRDVASGQFARSDLDAGPAP
jgi:3-hydroxymyristoyl/3-hydroxydecanoyl-(acyl carrier protein) dehydratase